MPLHIENGSFKDLSNLEKLKLEEDLLEHGIQPYFVFNDGIVWNVPKHLRVIDPTKDEVVTFSEYKVVCKKLSKTDGVDEAKYVVWLQEVEPSTTGKTRIHGDTSFKNKRVQSFYMLAIDFCEKICNAPINDNIRNDFARVGKNNQKTLSFAKQLSLTREHIYNLQKEMRQTLRSVFDVDPNDYDEKTIDQAYASLSDGYTKDYVKTVILDKQQVNKEVFLRQIEERYKEADFITLDDDTLLAIATSGLSANTEPSNPQTKTDSETKQKIAPEIAPEVKGLFDRKVNVQDLEGIDLSDW